MHETGGEAFYNTNDLAARVQKMLEDNRIYYELAYYPSQDTNPNKLRRISVSVKDHPEYVVRAQRSYILSELRAPKAGTQGQVPATELQKSMSRPLPLTDVGVIADAEFSAREKNLSEIDLQLQIEGKNLSCQRKSRYFLSELEVAAVVFDIDGKPVLPINDRVQVKIPPEQLDLARSRGYRFTRRIAVSPGLYHIRVGVRDIQSERIGTAISWVEVPDLKKGKLILSKISLAAPALLMDKTPAGLRGQAKKEPEEINGLRLFKRGENIGYNCMIYNAPLSDPGDDVRMQLEIYRSEQRIYLEPWFPPPSSVRAKDNIGMEIVGELKQDFLQPGVYEMRIGIKTTKSNQKAQRAISFVVAP